MFSFRFLLTIIFHYNLLIHSTVTTQITEKLLIIGLNSDSILVIIRHLYENGHDVLTHDMNASGAKRGLDLLIPSFFHDATAHSGPGPPHFRGFIITLRHTTLGRNPLEK